MKQAADLESSRESVTGVREASGRQELDPPTEEIDLEAAEIGALAAAAAPAPELPLRTSVPPPPPPAALRVRQASPTPVPPSPPPLPAARMRAMMPPAPGGLGVRPPVLPRRPEPAPAVSADPQADPLKEELERLTKRMRERDAYLAELESVYAQREAALIKAEEQLDELKKQLEEQRERIEELERARRPATVPPAAVEDDLTRIRGIGPRYARQLQAAGVRSFAAIAAWAPADILAISRELKITPSRIERDEWVAQARVLVKLMHPSAV
jgi:predicted flap endonuclease-1-like 5' DNA nuclease